MQLISELTRAVLRKAAANAELANTNHAPKEETFINPELRVNSAVART